MESRDDRDLGSTTRTPTCGRCQAEAKFMTPEGILCPEDALLDLVAAAPDRGWYPVALDHWPSLSDS